MKKINFSFYLILFMLFLSILAINLPVRIFLFSITLFLVFINRKDISQYFFEKYQNEKLKELEFNVASLNKEKENIENQKETLKNNMENLSLINENLTLENNRGKSIKAKIEKYQNELNILEKNYQEKNIALKDLEENIKQLETSMKNIENSTNAKIKFTDSKLQTLNSNVSSLTTKKAILIEEINNLTNEKFELEEQIELLRPKVPELSSITIEQIDNMDPYKFEYFTKLLLEKLDFKNVEVTNASGDYGIDVIAEQDDIKYGFQCKLYSDNVGVSAIQQAYAGIQHYDCNIGVVITNSTFTKQAQKQASETNVILWDRNKLMDKLSETDYSFNINF